MPEEIDQAGEAAGPFPAAKLADWVRGITEWFSGAVDYEIPRRLVAEIGISKATLQGG